MRFAYSTSGRSNGWLMRYKVDADVVAGQPVIWEGNTAPEAEVTDPTTTAFADVLGVTLAAATYTATQAITMVEGVVTVIANPDAVFRAVASGGATAGTALSRTNPANILSNATADATGLTVADTAVGTISFAGGTIWGTLGGNVDVSRTIDTHNNDVSEVVVVPFPATIAVGDRFVKLPWRPGSQSLQLTATPNFTEANAIIVVGTGGAVRVTEVRVNANGGSNETAEVFFVFGDHSLNPLS